MALTATANNRVMKDIVDQLGIQGCDVLKHSFNRPNLYYEIIPKTKDSNIAKWIHDNHKGHSGVIYCLARKTCERLAQCLRDEHKLNAVHFHADLPPEERTARQALWKDGKYDIIVATVSHRPSRRNLSYHFQYRLRSVWASIKQTVRLTLEVQLGF